MSIERRISSTERSEKNTRLKSVSIAPDSKKSKLDGALSSKLKTLDQQKDFLPAKHKVLRRMQEIPSVSYNDVWDFDGNHHWERDLETYDETFEPILRKLKVGSFKELVDLMSSKLKRNVNVLDLFGGAYFLSNLDKIEKFTGVRLRNVDQLLVEYQKADLLNRGRKDKQKELEHLISSKKRNIIEGNLYKSETWRKIGGGESSNFDLIVCRPVGPFKNRDVSTIRSVKDEALIREEIFVVLLERALKLLSKDGGILFTQVPILGTDRQVWEDFWEDYIQKKQKEGYEFLFKENETFPDEDIFAVRRIS